MQGIKLKDIAAAIGAKSDSETIIQSICIDTRKIVKGCLFIAIKGENFDGHDFVQKAFELGAAAVVSHKNIAADGEVLLVKNTHRALLELAAYYKSFFNTFIVGVTGSVGKTSTKEMIYAILSENGKTLKTEGNFNNEIGMPMSMFNLDSSYKNGVFEMGMDKFGQISDLSMVCKPDIGVITNIGVSHIESLGSRDNILKAKLEILDYMKSGAPLLLNGDDDKLITVKQPENHKIMYYGIENKSSDVYAKDLETVDDETTFTLVYNNKDYKASVPAIGKHNIYNALAGFLVGTIIGMKPEEIITSMKNYRNTGLRQQTNVIGGVTVIADCYNASPDSMKSAIDVITATSCTGKRYCVFGDMLELGDFSKEAHMGVGKRTAESDVDVLVCYGNDAKYIYDGAIQSGMTNVYYSEDKKNIFEYLKRNVKPGDGIIFKASRGMKLEDVINMLNEEWQKC